MLGQFYSFLCQLINVRGPKNATKTVRYYSESVQGNGDEE